MTTLRNVLIVAPHFPPSSLAAVHRARHMARFLPRHGWRPVVMHADRTRYAERPDEGLRAVVDPGLIEIDAPTLSPAMARRIGFGDLGLRMMPGLKRTLARAIEEHRPEVVFFTGFPIYPMLLTGWIKRRWGLPVVLDFQDPWVSDFGAAAPLLSKQGLAHRLACWLEPKFVRHADWVTSVSQLQNQQMAHRYPWLDPNRMSAIVIGGDADDFQASQTRAAWAESILDQGKVNLSYVGAYWPAARETFRLLLRAAARLKAADPGTAARLRLNFVGGGAANGLPISELAAEEGVQDMIQEIPERQPYLEALAVSALSNGLLMIGSNEPHYTASKIYTGLMSGKPYLSIFHADSSAHDVLTRAGGGRAIGFRGWDDLQSQIDDMAEGLRSLATAPASLGSANPAAYEAYTADAVSRQFAEIFNRVSEART